MKGNIIHHPPQANYVKVVKNILYDDRIDIFSLGIYLKICGLKQNWELSIRGCAKAFRVSEDRVRKAFKVLIDARYMIRTHTKNESGQYTGWAYELNPDTSIDSSAPVAQNHHLEKPSSEKTNVGKNQRWEKPTMENTSVGENQSLENAPQTIDHTHTKSITPNRNHKRTDSPADFISFLLECGVSWEVAEEWMRVRRQKGAVDTEIGRDELKKELAKADCSADDCIRFAIVRSWKEFRWQWYLSAHMSKSRSDDAVSSMLGLAHIIINANNNE